MGSCQQLGLAALGHHLLWEFSNHKPPPEAPRPLSVLQRAPGVKVRSVLELAKADRLHSNLRASIQPVFGPQLVGQLVLGATVHSVLE